MISSFIEIHKRLINLTTYQHHRNIYQEFNINNRLTGLIGPRGTGKTTLLLQFIKEKMQNSSDCLYISIDNIYFSSNLLFDFVRNLYDDYGIRYFFLDEIHKYKNWSQELKNIYDSYPDVKLVFSGSSSLDLVKGTHDLSRRGIIFRVNGMSFREYLIFNDISKIEAITMTDIIDNRAEVEQKISSIKKLKGHFKEYLLTGYYPFYLEGRDSYHEKMLRMVQKTIYEDISSFYKLKTENLHYFNRIMSYLATIPPSEINRNSIAKNSGLDNKTVQNYLTIMHETGLIELISNNKSGSNLLKPTEKIYLDNPNIYSAIAKEIGHAPKTGTIRELFFINMLVNSGHSLFVSKVGDFEVDGVIFEVGGQNKTKKQIKDNLKNSYLVKDDILYGSKYEIPLYLFGLLY
jgi:uncharacterized protein